MLAKDIKKDWAIQFTDGLQGTMKDNRNTLMRLVEHTSPIFGSKYLSERTVNDISATDQGKNDWVAIEHTANQRKSKQAMDSLDDMLRGIS
jgi:hypothetical protein